MSEETQYEERSEGGIAEGVRRIAYLGAGALFMTQEALTRALRDLKLPKEVIQGVLNQVEKNKQEIIGAFRDEISSAVRNMDWAKLVRDSLNDAEIEFTSKVKIRYGKKEE